MQEGFLELQNALDQAIMQELSPNHSMTLLSPNLNRFPYPPYNNDLFILVLQNQFPFIVMLSFVFSALQIVKDIVHEKERRLKVRNSSVPVKLVFNVSFSFRCCLVGLNHVSYIFSFVVYFLLNVPQHS